jgi:branched-chain amino acid transport system ATP-binding protein
MESVLTVEKIGKSFGGLEILKDISFHVKKGERIGIIGGNGAGKTTLFNIIAGDLEASKGDIFYQGKNVTNVPNYKRVCSGMVRTFQKNNLLNELSVLDNLLLVLQRKAGVENTWFKPLSKPHFPEIYESAFSLLELWNLTDRQDILVKNLSYGEQRQIEILLGVALEPNVLLLDEPTAGMSNAETKYILDLLNRLPEDLTILIIEHDLEVIFSVSDKVIVLNNGEVLVQGEPSLIKTDPRVTEMYIGKEEVL